MGIDANVCEAGESFTLDYIGAFEESNPYGIGASTYNLHLQGTVKTVVPAAAWLFESGLLGLASITRHRKAA